MCLPLPPGTQASPTRSTALCCAVGWGAEGRENDSLLPAPQTRVLVTHGISFLPQTDFIIVLADGQVSEVGTYTALLQRDGSFANFLRNYAPDDTKDHQEADSRTGIHLPPASIAPHPPSMSPVLGSLSFSGRAQRCTRRF